MIDLPARWSSDAWRAELEVWLLPAIEATGRVVTGELVQERVRFWSTVLSIETDQGKVWVKENAPSQAFEAALAQAVEAIAPGTVAPIVALEPSRGWLATADLGMPLWHDDTMPPPSEWLPMARQFASAQRALAAHEDALLATGLSRFPKEPDDVVAWVERLLAELVHLPDEDPRRPSATEADGIRDGLGRVRDAAATLVASGLPDSLQHNDLHLGNAFRLGDGAAFIDLGDALWTHPLTVARIPVWILRGRRELPADHPDLVALTDAFLEPWTDLADLDTLRGLMPAADRISCLHRAESWRRLIADVPLECVDERFRRSVTEWLIDATAPDPFSSATSH
ncbi:phosphotransferase [Knoellia subterranea]|uniref:Aminoglycoside phosphotransferase domain-containing protein n=1 Tax=Knoellia subterranea KCTC 19937 TaxID=1385521 RepID=A0A0A0JMH8_9MICO|nr:phosphotransferase [Knoellia subterranea]KGN38343.1 hypothetical protein N803_11085 [Knoellia subterranea KCTC 19937]